MIDEQKVAKTVLGNYYVTTIQRRSVQNLIYFKTQRRNESENHLELKEQPECRTAMGNSSGTYLALRSGCASDFSGIRNKKEHSSTYIKRAIRKREKEESVIDNRLIKDDFFFNT
ncbi:hypothetical protein PUN28_016458 [Cardiocondyla obscurior]|uniref:Uncharacterized protein n=1 Tax=Cardiocondyla obscurior TaxID=286306 RepID=A0AAW2EM70_9HYME